MAIQQLTCPNTQCGVQLQLAQTVAAGTKISCPKCGTVFRTGGSETAHPPPAPAAKETFALAAETDRPCPGCKAVLAADAVVCGVCGFDLTGARAPKRRSKSAKPPQLPGTSRSQDADEDSSGEFATLLAEADEAIEDTRQALAKPLPIFRDLDLAVVNMRAASRLLAATCAIPNCKGRAERFHKDKKVAYVVIPAGALPMSGGRTLHTKELTLTLCGVCRIRYVEEMTLRQTYTRDLLEPTYQELHKAQAQGADHPGIDKRIEQMDELARRAKVTLNSGRRKCFIATASYGSPFATEVETLRQYRDVVLQPSRLGRWLIRCYDALSPPLAVSLTRSKHGRGFVRWLLQPLVTHCARRLDRARHTRKETR